MSDENICKDGLDMITQEEIHHTDEGVIIIETAKDVYQCYNGQNLLDYFQSIDNFDTNYWLNYPYPLIKEPKVAKFLMLAWYLTSSLINEAYIMDPNNQINKGPIYYKDVSTGVILDKNTIDSIYFNPNNKLKLIKLTTKTYKDQDIYTYCPELDINCDVYYQNNLIEKMNYLNSMGLDILKERGLSEFINKNRDILTHNHEVLSGDPELYSFEDTQASGIQPSLSLYYKQEILFDFWFKSDVYKSNPTFMKVDNYNKESYWFDDEGYYFRKGNKYNYYSSGMTSRNNKIQDFMWYDKQHSLIKSITYKNNKLFSINERKRNK